MINHNDSIRCTNVISRKYRFHYKEMEAALSDFTNDVVKLNATIKGPLFYSLNNIPKDEIMNVEFFMPVKEDKVDIYDDMLFQSYFNIENTISICIHNEFETNTEVGYKILFDYMEQKHLRQVTPIFHVMSGDQTMQYVFIKIGVTQEDIKEIWK
ncbi:DUF5085 family protein [Cytobacillus sp. IB215316]|uniref:DUF5085 family protein n=1 Tax=Cytobacillus sp. IB215316 TaxID=3097354 RepID=UPI002A12DAE0|nr:DUF5085 family protein [Cytobacillus sp. IB215316]MDX8360754.1 DUF5085 family protein [Cytobacillus sp. IB215316]